MTRSTVLTTLVAASLLMLALGAGPGHVAIGEAHLAGLTEELILDLRPHWWYLAPSGAVVVLSVLLGIAALVQSWWRPLEIVVGMAVLAALAWFGLMYMRWTTTNFVVTNERVISRTGIIAKQGIEIPLDRINTVFFNQSL